MNPSNEFPFTMLTGTFWILNFILLIYFQSKTRKVQISFSRDERRAKLGFRVFAIASLFVPVYCFSPEFVLVPARTSQMS
jgi:hypothetical protein